MSDTNRPYIHILPLDSIGYDIAEFLKPSDKLRANFTPSHYLCLPLTAANTLGWTLYNPFPFTVTWIGGSEKEGVVVECDRNDWARSWFGHATFSVDVGFLVETSPGIDLLVRPVPNHWKLPVMPFDGIVETDWLQGSFTINFRLMMPMMKARYAVGEPLVQFVPYPRQFIEDFDTEIITDGEKYKQRLSNYREWAEKRHELLKQGLRVAHSEMDLDYMRGHHSDGAPGATDHKKVFHLSSFKPANQEPSDSLQTKKD